MEAGTKLKDMEKWPLLNCSSFSAFLYSLELPTHSGLALTKLLLIYCFLIQSRTTYPQGFGPPTSIINLKDAPLTCLRASLMETFFFLSTAPSQMLLTYVELVKKLISAEAIPREKTKRLSGRTGKKWNATEMSPVDWKGDVLKAEYRACEGRQMCGNQHRRRCHDAHQSPLWVSQFREEGRLARDRQEDLMMTISVYVEYGRNEN